MTVGQKFKPDELIASIDPIYRIYMVFGEGWYVVNGLTKKTECILNPAIHRVILETAVNLALKSRAGAGS